MKITCVPNRYSFLAFVVILATSFTTFSQNLSKVDSLKLELGLGGDSNRFNVLWGLAFELFDVDNPQAIIYAQEAYKYALKKGDSTGIVMAGRISGQLLRRLDKLDESIKILLEVLPASQSKELIREHKMILNALALA